MELYEEVHVRFDKTGDPEFIESLEHYMEKNLGFGPTLFSHNTFKACDDIEEEPLVQLADLYAGTIGKYFNRHGDANKSAKIYENFLRSKLTIEWLPKENVPLLVASSAFNGDFNLEMYQMAMQTGIDYIQNNKDDIIGCEIIEYIMQENKRNPMRVVSSKEIKAFLNNKGIEIGDPIIKISELRDHGLILISPIGKKGYKFPTNEKEIAEFFNRLISNVYPQLRRGYMMNKLLISKSIGKFNVMGNPEYKLLEELSERVVNNKKEIDTRNS